MRRVQKNEQGGTSEIIAEVFVDDIKWATNDTEALKDVICSVGDQFQITVGPKKVDSSLRDKVDWNHAKISTYLGMKYPQTFDEEGHVTLAVNQTTYIDQVIKRFELDGGDYAGRDTPLPAASSIKELEKKIGKLDDEKLIAWSKKYSFPMIVGSLIHAMVHTRPDIAYAVSVLSRHMSKPELWHYKAAQHLLLYLRETRTLGLEYSQKKMLAHTGPLITGTFDTNDHDKDRRSYKTFNDFLEGAVDASFADDDGTARSTSGFVIWFCGMPVEFECKRQPLVTLSTMESEYVAASRCVLSVRFLHKFMDFVQLDRAGPTKVHEDNAACIAITAKPVHRSRSKHIAVKYHNVREAVENGEVELVQVWTEHQVADLFTRSRSRRKPFSV